MNNSEVIARLDVFERALSGMISEIRQLRIDLVESLDIDDAV